MPGLKSNSKCYILNQFAAKNANYTSWMEDCPLECRIVDTSAARWSPPKDAGIVVTHMHYRWEEVSALRRVYEETNLPILILSDGILEFRNTWENPTLADGAVFQPIVGHKLACLGQAQARVVESWGETGKCEVVGSPRLEAWGDEFLPVQKDGPFRILIATASTPAFTKEQREKVVSSLLHLKQRFDKNQFVNNRPVEITWRLTDGLAVELGINESSRQTTLEDAIELADAVITTPSTLYLESVLKRRPTAVLDFSNSPSYVPSAWQITAPAHINQVLSELESPPAAKMKFQRSILHDQLESKGSTERMHTLIRQMVDLAEQSRLAGHQKLVLPARILPNPRRGFQAVESEFDAIALHPHNSVYRLKDIDLVKQELNLAIARLKDMPDELSRKEHRIAQKEHHIESLSKLLEESEARILASNAREAKQTELLNQKNLFLLKKSQHIESLNEHFQNANQRAKSLSLRVNKQAISVVELRATIKSLSEKLFELQGVMPAEIEMQDTHSDSEVPVILKFPTDKRAA